MSNTNLGNTARNTTEHKVQENIVGFTGRGWTHFDLIWKYRSYLSCRTRIFVCSRTAILKNVIFDERLRSSLALTRGKYWSSKLKKSIISSPVPVYCEAVTEIETKFFVFSVVWEIVARQLSIFTPTFRHPNHSPSEIAVFHHSQVFYHPRQFPLARQNRLRHPPKMIARPLKRFFLILTSKNFIQSLTEKFDLKQFWPQKFDFKKSWTLKILLWALAFNFASFRFFIDFSARAFNSLCKSSCSSSVVFSGSFLKFNFLLELLLLPVVV